MIRGRPAGPAGPPAPRRTRRLRRLHRIVLRRPRRAEQPRLLRLQGRPGQRDPHAGRRMGRLRDRRGQLRPGLRRDGAQCRVPDRPRQPGPPGAAHPRRARRHGRGDRPADRGGPHRRLPVPHRRDHHRRRSARTTPVTALFDRLDQLTPLDEVEAEFVEQVRKAATEKIAPRAEEYDQAEEFPWENVKLLNSLGLNGVFIPEEYGGTPLSYRGYLQLVEAISRACPATAITWA